MEKNTNDADVLQALDRQLMILARLIDSGQGNKQAHILLMERAVAVARARLTSEAAWALNGMIVAFDELSQQAAK